MYRTRHIRPTKLDLCELMAVFDEEWLLTFKEIRRSVMIATCDLRSSAFNEVFSSAVEAGFISETEEGSFRLTASGAFVLDQLESGIPVDEIERSSRLTRTTE